MKKILAIAWNDVRNEFSSKLELLFFLFLPLLFTIIVGIGLGSSGGSDGDGRYDVLVVDHDSSPLSGKLLEMLGASEVIHTHAVSAAEAEERFTTDKWPAILTIPAGFGADLMAGRQAILDLRNQPQDNTTLAVDQVVSGTAQKLEAAVSVALDSAARADEKRKFASPSERADYLQQSLELAFTELEDPSAKTRMVTAQTEIAAVPTGFAQSSPGQLVTWVLTTLVGGAAVFVEERINGTLRRMLVLPITRATYMAGKIIGRLGMGLVQMLILVGFGALALGVNYGRSLLGLIIMLVAFGLAGTSLGVMLGAFARTRSQAGTLSILISMLLSALGGAWWPLEVTPPAYQAAVKFLPSTWAVSGLQELVTRGGGVVDILPAAGILVGFSVVFFTIGIMKLKFE